MSSPIAEYRSIQLGPDRDLQNEAKIISEVQEPVSAHNFAETAGERVTTGIERHIAEERSQQEQSENWRDEIASRLNNYAKRRGRKHLAGDYSMQLDFDRPRRSNTATAHALDPIVDSVVEATAPEASARTIEAHDLNYSEPEPESRSSLTTAEIVSNFDVSVSAHAEPAPALAPERPKRKTQHRIIEFPRLFPNERAETSSDELAEAINKPRILDVPEETDRIVLPLADLSLEMQQHAEEAAPERNFELPLQVAGISQRMLAALADSAIVLFAIAIFTGIALNMAKDMPHNKFTLIASVVIPGVIWSVYHYLFLVHSAATPGMKLAQLRLATFNGAPTTRQLRRNRALGLILSLVSAGMGYGWALVDEDTLCWHDRISRTFLANR